ncbi:hypothetical protein EDF46_0328 [Frondihabitans sp. PhB188]|nr:hypothetical protein EDF46_0328 [Frondihabitans sp. PhB188]
MGVRGSGEALNKILGQSPASHPFAFGSFGHWVIQQRPASPLGWVLARNDSGVWVFDAYARCRDNTGRRPWLKTFKSLNSAVAWMLQHERELRDLMDRSDPEPE